MAPSSPPKTALEHFDRLAESYERSTGGCTRDLAAKTLGLLDPPIGRHSVVLDNACGTGVVTDEILRRSSSSSSSGGPEEQPMEIHAVDGAPGMVELARAKFAGRGNVEAQVMRGEDLSGFPDDKFTHSVTGLGLFFFEDPAAGAREIFRTLRPGGVALVTGWRDLGWPGVIRTVQVAVKPDAPAVQVPMPKEWFDPGHTEEVLRSAGFAEVEMREEEVGYAGADGTVAGLCDLLMGDFGARVFQDWSTEEKAQVAEAFPAVVEAAMKTYCRDGSEVVGVPMKAIVAICRK